MKRVSVALILILIATSFTSMAAVKPKPGASCSKKGQVSKNKAMVLQCEVVGKKKIWIKRKSGISKVPVQSPSPTNTQAEPNPAPSSPSMKQSPSPTPTPSSDSELIESPKPSSPDSCRLRDQRKNQILRLEHFERNNGFPLQGATLPTEAKLKLLSFFIDFPDATGSTEDLQFFRQQEKIMIDWFAEASQGKLVAELITSDKWFTAPKPSTSYELIPSQYGTHPIYAQEFINLTGNSFNWDGVHAFMVHFPKSQKTKLQSAQLGRAIELKTPQGNKVLNYQYFGPWHIDFAERVKNKNPDYLAGQWLHEHLHDLGLTLHAPGNGFYSGVGQNQGSYSHALSAWELFKLGWLDDSQVFCSQVSDLSMNLINLIPLERSESGNKIAIFVIDKARAIVVESRRPEGLSKRWPKNLSGLYVYEIDTSLDTDRTHEFNGSGLDNGNNRKFSKWAFYIDSDQRPIDDVLPESKINPETFYQEWLIKVGETVTTEDVKITFRRTGNSDWIEVKKS